LFASDEHVFGAAGDASAGRPQLRLPPRLFFSSFDRLRVTRLRVFGLVSIFGVCRKSVIRPVRDFRRELLRIFAAEGFAPGENFQSPIDCGSPDCGCSDFVDFLIARRVAFARENQSIFTFERLAPGENFQSPIDCGSPDCGCSFSPAV